MPFTLENAVPWGRSFDEYVEMFRLAPHDLRGRILGIADGPASFNAEAARRGARVVSADPIYQFPPEAIRRRIAETSAVVLEQTRRNAGEFNWTRIPSIGELARLRHGAMNKFLADYPAGARQGRYIAATLPSLPFPDSAFDLAVCSHFLFLYSEQFNAGFHIQSIRELLRAAREVRVFPLLELGTKPSRHLHIVIESLRAEGFEVTIETTPYEFQKGGNQLLRARNQ